MEWKEKLKAILKDGCSDSDIEDFISEHSELNGKEVWDYVYDLQAPDTCKGCKYVQHEGMLPCIRCSRRIITNDYYESR